MPFTKGMQKHPDAGRKPGTKNKFSIKSVRELLLEKGIDPIQKMIESIEFLPEEKHFDAWSRVTEFIQPKLKSIEVSGSIESKTPLVQIVLPSNEREVYQLTQTDPVQVPEETKRLTSGS